MTNLEKLNILFDDYLIYNNKSFIPLRTANDLLRNSGDPDLVDIDLKKLLESGLISNAVQTETPPRQWRIFPSEQNIGNKHDFPEGHTKRTTPVDAFRQKRQTKIKSKPLKGHPTNYEYDRYALLGLLFSIALIAFFYFFDFDTGNKSSLVERSLEQNMQLDQESTAELQKFHSFKSSYNDKEYINGGIIQTNNETTYHTFDFQNRKVTCYAPVEGKYILIEYHMKGFYKEPGALASTYVIRVEDKGVQEIWFSPELPNIGYDYDDGTRISCYGITRTDTPLFSF